MTVAAKDDRIRRTELVTHVLILLVVGALLVPLLLWPGIAWAVWWLSPSKDLDVFVYDQTVPDASYLEHASLGLVLEYEKIPFDTDDSFVGAAPGGAPHGSWPTEAPDLAMLVDGYGVYADSAGQVSDEGTVRITAVIRTADAGRVIEWAGQGSLVYGEFNILGEPTETPASSDLQALFGVDRTGWAGRPYDDLAAVSDRLVALAGGEWGYSGPGIVLLGPPRSGSAVVVLSSAELESLLPTVEGMLPGSGRTASAGVDGWFEIIRARPGTSVDMTMRLDVSDSGRTRLRDQGIPTEWPFLVRTDKTLYLAADASENSIEFPLRRMTGSPVLMRMLPQSPKTEFFYRIYLPVVQWLIGEAAS